MNIREALAAAIDALQAIAAPDDEPLPVQKAEAAEARLELLTLLDCGEALDQFMVDQLEPGDRPASEVLGGNNRSAVR
jgi:hypothetical protein